jgi:integrase
MPASAETLSEYIAHLDREGSRVKTVGVALAAIDSAHARLGQSSGRHDPLVRQTLRGLARKQAGIPPSDARKRPLTADLMARLVSPIGTSALIDVRDRAMLLVGFASACRASELTALEVSDVELRPEGAILRIRQSKTDQEGCGALVEVYPGASHELCPVAALRAWLACSGLTSGALFREVVPRIAPWKMGPDAVRDIVKRRCPKAGLDPKDYSAHSLRSGFVTSASFAGKPLERIMQTTRHKSADVARQYVRQGELLKDGAGKGLL